MYPPFSQEDAVQFLEEANELRVAFSVLKSAVEEVLPKLREVKKAIHACWLEAETADEATFWGELEEDLDQIINKLEETLKEVGE